jgi:hypothetical protein
MSAQRLAAIATPRKKSSPQSIITVPRQADSWSVTQRGSIVEVGFGHGVDFPQYAAVHTNDGFLRLNCGPGSGWGSSIILLPSFWENGRYYQGAQISIAWLVDVTDLVMSFSGSLSNIRAFGEVRLTPPKTDRISCTVGVTVDGDLDLDRRPSEAFKPVAISSMHVSADQWDAKSVQVDSKSFQMPDNGWIVRPAVVGKRFALTGGNSTWKRRAPSLEIELDGSLEITGWKTDSLNPDDDNLAVWAASDRVVRLWKYSVNATTEADLPARSNNFES